MEPPVARDSTTTSTSLNAARIRLRMGKRCGSGGVPGGDSLINSPRLPISLQMRSCSGGYTMSRPDATIAIGGDPSFAFRDSAPTCDSTSMPRANPDTTLTPAADNCFPSS